MADKGKAPKPAEGSDGDKGAKKPPNPGRSVLGTREPGGNDVAFGKPVPKK